MSRDIEATGRIVNNETRKKQYTNIATKVRHGIRKVIT